MIGHLAKLIKSRLHPEENLVNRQLRSCASRAAGFTASRVAADADADDDDEAADPHPLVRQDARHSMADKARVVWPRGNSTNAKGRVDVAEHEGALAQLHHMLGPDICDLHRGLSPAFTRQRVLSSVVKGLYTLVPKEVEDRRAFSNSCSSWYSIPSARVPHYTVPVRPPSVEHQFTYQFENPLNPTLYGCIHSFVEVTVPAWKCEPFRLAQGLLYAGDHSERYTGFHCIDQRWPLRSVAKVALEYVQVQDILATVAIGPVNANLLFIMPIPL
jgi:hypothetical protein